MDIELETFIAGKNTLQKDALDGISGILHRLWKQITPDLIQKGAFQDPCEVLSIMVSITFNMFSAHYGEGNARKLIEGIIKEYGNEPKPVIH